MFFTHLDQVMSPGLDYNLTISKTDTGMTVLFIPRANGLEDKAQSHLIPLTFKGTPQELDANFLPGIATPIRQVSGMLTNMEQFEKAAKKAEANSKAAKEQEKKDSKEAKEKKEKYDSFIKKAEEFEKAGNFESALTNLQQARLHATEKTVKAVDDKIRIVKEKLSQGNLFESLATPQAQAQPATLPVQQPMQPGQQPAIQQPVQQFTEQHPAYQNQPVQQPQQPPQAQPAMQQNAPGFGMFSHGQAFAGPQYQQPPMQNAGIGVGVEPRFDTNDNSQTCRENEYAGYPDFPQEMKPPYHNGHNNNIYKEQ